MVIPDRSVPAVYLSNVTAQGVGRFMTMSANFAAFVLLARYLGTETLGKYTYILNFISIAIIIVEFGTTGVMSKQLAHIEERGAQVYWGNFLFLRIIVCLAFLLPVLGVALFLRSDLFTFVLCCVLALPFLASRFFEPVYQIYGHPWYSALSNGFYAVVWLAAVLVIISYFRSLGWVITGYVVSNILYTLIAYHLASSLLRPIYQININHIKKILALSLPIWVSSVFGALNARISILMLSSMQSDKAVGLYSVPFRFLEMAALFGMVLANPLVPIFSKMAHRNAASLKLLFARLIEIIAIFTIPIVSMAPLFSKNVINIIFGNKFIETANALNVIVCISVIVIFNLLCSVLALSLGVVLHGYWNTASAVMLTMAMNYIYIPKYGYIACAWAALASEILLFIIVMFFIIRKIGNFIDLSRWFYIFAANFIFFISLRYNILSLNYVVHIFLSFAIYIFIIVLSRLIDRSDFIFIWKQIRTKT